MHDFRLFKESYAGIAPETLCLGDAGYLGIHKLHAIIGSSLGGMMCLNLATRYPDRVQLVFPIATGMDEHKFGISLERAAALAREAAAMPRVRLTGVG